MEENRAKKNSGLLFGIMILVSFICVGIVADMLSGCSGECASGLVEIVQSYPAEHSFHRIDTANPDPSYLQAMKNYGL